LKSFCCWYDGEESHPDDKYAIYYLYYYSMILLIESKKIIPFNSSNFIYWETTIILFHHESSSFRLFLHPSSHNYYERTQKPSDSTLSIKKETFLCGQFYYSDMLLLVAML